MSPISRLRSDFSFDEAYKSGEVPLNEDHLITDYENRRLAIATAAGAGEISYIGGICL